ncbi:MAG: hypothetical protein M3M84_00905 [Thermoproteota archaeon]|nr:hypothetical protein [Thermoproteota archaeon]
MITGVDVVKIALNSWQEYNKMPSERETVTVNSLKGYICNRWSGGASLTA